MPDNPDELTVLVQGYELIDDKAARPCRLQVFPEEVVLHSKRKKAHSVKTTPVSEFLKCAACGETNALVLEGDTFKGECGKCGLLNEIQRTLELCPVETCKNEAKERSKVSLFIYGDKIEGVCGVCRTAVRRDLGGNAA